jgi:hypothetical protein
MTGVVDSVVTTETGLISIKSCCYSIIRGEGGGIIILLSLIEGQKTN